MRRTMVVVVLASLPALAGGNDHSPSLDPGARVRVTVTDPGARPLVGTLESLRGQSLVLRVDDDPYPIPRAAVRRIEVSRGRRISRRWTTLGAAAGGAAGAFVGGCLANKDDYGVLCGGQDDTKYVIGGIVGGLAGGALGAWLGRGERWEEVDLRRLGAARRARSVLGPDRLGPPVRRP
jgi:hypothetical protein